MRPGSPAPRRAPLSTALRRRARHACSAVVLGLSASASHAAVVQLDFSGTYDTRGNVLFGQTGTAVAYHYSITYDTALNTNGSVFEAGQAVGTGTAGSALYGYSASGIVATRLSFGTQTWTAADLQARQLAAGIAADLWFDTDIAQAVPDTAWMYFQSGVATLALGQGWNTASGLVLADTTSMSDRDEWGSLIEARGTMAIDAVPGVTVPEPGTLFLAASGLLAARLRLRHLSTAARRALACVLSVDHPGARTRRGSSHLPIPASSSSALRVASNVPA